MVQKYTSAIRADVNKFMFHRCVCLRYWSSCWCEGKVLADELKTSVRKTPPPVSLYQIMSGIKRNYFNCTHKPWSGRATAEKMRTVRNHRNQILHLIYH